MAKTLTAADRTRIEATIAEIEQSTAAELVVVTAPASATYYEVKLTYALLGALGAGAGVHYGLPELTVSSVLWVQLLAALVMLSMCSIPAVLRRVVPRALLQQQVEQRAALAFLEHGVFATRDRTGVLILISELEHRVAILGDEGIHKALQSSGWERYVTDLVKSIREGRAGQGVCDTLQAIGKVLIAQFPPRPDDVNELPNTVRDTR